MLLKANIFIKRNKRNILKTKRARILKRDNGLCRYCGDPATEIDHVVPWFLNQNNNDSNLVASCRRCNGLAGDVVLTSVEDKRAYIQSRV